MCFGPVASFTVGTVLASIGTAVLRQVRAKKEFLLAAFPMIFAVQQFIEGLLWLFLRNQKSPAVLQALTFIYLVFAFSFWPVLAPASVYALEENPKKRKLLGLLLLLGTATSAALLFFIITRPIRAIALSCSLHYQVFVPATYWFIGAYALTATLPYFLSSHRGLRLFGIPNLIFFAVTFLFYRMAFVSLWCFFAAILSFTLYFFLKNLRRDQLPT